MKNRSSFPENVLAGRRAPFAIVETFPWPSVSQVTIQLVSPQALLRMRIAGECSTGILISYPQWKK